MKITSAKNAGTFEYKGDTFYRQDVTLDDGTTGQVNAKTEGKWKVGDEVEIKSKKETQYGTRLSLQKPQQGGGYSGGYSGSKKKPAFSVSWAKNLFVAGKIQMQDIEEKAIEYAHMANNIKHGSVVVSYANDLACAGLIDVSQVQEAAEKFSLIVDKVEAL